MSDKKAGTSVVTSDDAAVMRALQVSLYPGSSIDSVRLVVAYCNAQHLDPFTKPVHLVPMRAKDDQGRWGTRDVIMPGINLYRIRADRTGDYKGASEPEYGPPITKTFAGRVKEYGDGNDGKFTWVEKEVEVTFPEWCRITVKKRFGSETIEWPAIEYWMENYATQSKDSDIPNSMWMKRPYAQLAKCTEAQALRRAFPDAVGAEPTYEERGVEEMTEASIVSTVEPGAARQAEPQPAATQEPNPKPTTRSDEVLSRTRRTNTPAPANAQQQEPVATQSAASSQGGDAKTPENAADEVFGSDPEFEALPGENWPESLVDVDALPTMTIDELNAAAGALQLEVEGPDVETNVARGRMVARLKDCYEKRVAPALSMWTADLIAQFGECSTAEYEGLQADAKRVADALTVTGQKPMVTLLRGAASNAKKRLGIAPKKAASESEVQS